MAITEKSRKEDWESITASIRKRVRVESVRADLEKAYILRERIAREYPRLQETHANKWVVMDKEEVFAARDSLAEALSFIEERKLNRSDVAVEFIRAKGDFMVI